MALQAYAPQPLSENDDRDRLALDECFPRSRRDRAPARRRTWWRPLCRAGRLRPGTGRELSAPASPTLDHCSVSEPSSGLDAFSTRAAKVLVLGGGSRIPRACADWRRPHVEDGLRPGFSVSFERLDQRRAFGSSSVRMILITLSMFQIGDQKSRPSTFEPDARSVSLR